MKNGLLYLLLPILFIGLNVSAQNSRKSSQSVIEQIAESFADDFDEDIDLSSILEDLERILESPLNINNTTRSELEKLHFFNTFQIEEILNYRKKVGQIYSIYELQAINGINSDLIEKLKAFVVFLAPDIEMKSYLKQDLYLRYAQVLETADGYIPNDDGEEAYAGIPASILLKYRAQKGEKYHFGITAENDPGEEFFQGNNEEGFDFYSAYFGYHGKKILKKVYIGDYQVKTGQGLIQWSNYSKRKSTDATNVRLSGQGLKASTSSVENQYLRGIATNFELGNFELISYYSNANVDANVVDFNENGKPIQVSSIQISGYHRTEGEIIDENSLNVQKAGANLKYRINRIAIGVNGVYEKYNVPLNLSDYAYNRYKYNGDNNFNISTDFLWITNKANFFGEAAYSKSGGKALLAGIEAQPANEISLSFLYRDYAANFHSINGSSFAEASKNNNERGFYSGISVFPISHIKLSAYYDIYETHWLKFASNRPVRGNDFVLQTDYTPSRKLNMYFRYKTELSSKKTSLPEQIKNDLEQRTSRARFHLNWKPNDILSIKFRGEWSAYQISDSIENGLLFFTDLVLTPFDKLSATARLNWFNTDGYNSRIYTYENDVPQYFYIPAFYYKGLRYYLNIKYKITESLTAYLKTSQLLFLDDSITIETGNSALNQNKKTDFKILLKYRF
ncbi:MAG: helix-hairpin-helix domain-containing protein [Prolixibacteraceae bacterium]|jgi:5-hydroxyisourate hydrolase-like protein (transthyretin family)|nr:helix-hairpin-helix domain-containing protein [Prolixibacteraceae bacterium]